MKHIEAMQKALDALLSCRDHPENEWSDARRDQAITALREALAEQQAPVQKRPQNCGTGHCSCIECPYEQPAQPQQEPFGYFRAEPFGWTDCAETDEGAIALYTRSPAQQQWIETACALIKAADDAAAASDYMLDSNDCIKVLRGEWNGHLMNDQPTPQLPAQQEPLLWLYHDSNSLDDALNEWAGLFGSVLVSLDRQKAYRNETPLYTAPPQRQPLTDEQLRECFCATNTCEPLSEGWPGLERFARAIEAAHGIKGDA